MTVVTIPNSVGYAGDINATEWAQFSPFFGQRYGVADAGSWVATPGAADREVRLSKGVGYGAGVMDRTTADVSLVLPATTSGSLYHLVYVNRDWNTSGGRSSFTTKPGTSALTIPARDTTPGNIDDQPLWLARVDAGKSQVQELIDLRVWRGPGGVYAARREVLQYLNEPGTSIFIGEETRADRIFDAFGNPRWRFTNEIDRFVKIGTFSEGFDHYPGFGWDGLFVGRSGSVVSGGGAIVKDAGGGGGTARKDKPIANIPVGYRPPSRTATTDPRLEITPGGDIVLTRDVEPQTTISFSFSYYQNTTGV